MKNIELLADRVLIRPTTAEEVTPSGIIIPQTYRANQLTGMVEVVGSGIKQDSSSLKTGAKVLFGQHSGIEVTVDGTPMLIVREPDIIGIIS